MKIVITFILLLFYVNSLSAQPAFKVIPLGVKGGADESNLSCYMVAAAGTEDYISLDAGTINAGIQKALAKHLLKGSAEAVLRNQIKGYLVSHGHLDHVAGLVLNSPEDAAKNIYAMPYTKEILKEKYFTTGSWSNFSDEGMNPLNKYHYVLLDSAKEIPLAHTGMFVTAFPLSHGNPYKSTAFLIRQKENYLLYLGDTGPDEIEHTHNLHDLWLYIAPLVKSKKLKAIFIECSFPDAQPGNRLFGHLNPQWLMKEMNELSLLTGTVTLTNFPIVITHIKPAGNHEAEIKKELSSSNHLHLKIIFATQSQQILF